MILLVKLHYIWYKVHRFLRVIAGISQTITDIFGIKSAKGTDVLIFEIFFYTQRKVML